MSGGIWDVVSSLGVREAAVNRTLLLVVVVWVGLRYSNDWCNGSDGDDGSGRGHWSSVLR